MQVVKQIAPDALPSAWVSRLLKKMQALYGAKFTQQWEGLDPLEIQQAWGEELAGFTGSELSRGLDACKQRPWPPTLPEFMTLCRPPILPEAAFHEAVRGLTARSRGERGAWSHVAIYHAAVNAGSHDVLSCTYAAIKSRWERALQDQLAKTEWPPVPDAHVALAAPKRTEASEAEAAAAMKSIGAAGVLDRKSGDMKNWARKIIANPKGRPLLVVSMAQQALREGATQ